MNDFTPRKSWSAPIANEHGTIHLLLSKSGRFALALNNKNSTEAYHVSDRFAAAFIAEFEGVDLQ